MIPNEYVIYLEIFGYIGTALVLLSMMMSSVVKLRIINICGSVISAVYAIMSVAYPVALLNVGLIAINTVQLVRYYRAKRSFRYVKVGADDEFLALFKKHYEKDLYDFFPNARFEGDIFIVFSGVTTVGILAGAIDGERMDVYVDYAAPEYRNYSIASFIFPIVKGCGVKHVYTDKAANRAHKKYLLAMGFTNIDGKMYKELT